MNRGELSVDGRRWWDGGAWRDGPQFRAPLPQDPEWHLVRTLAHQATPDGTMTDSRPQIRPWAQMATDDQPIAAHRADAPARFGRKTFAVLWVVTLVIGAVSLGLLYQDDSAWADRTATAQLKVHDLNLSVNTLRTENGGLQVTNSALTSEAAHPTLRIWNVAQTISGSSAYLVGGVPDTFTYKVSFTSTAPVAVNIMTTAEFVSAIDCVRLGYGTSHYCMTHAGTSWWSDRTSLTNGMFSDAEGCAGYLAVWTAASPATVTPDVSITYNPASAATGACR
jgi:hypothetical protein